MQDEKSDPQQEEPKAELAPVVSWVGQKYEEATQETEVSVFKPREETQRHSSLEASGEGHPETNCGPLPKTSVLTWPKLPSTSFCPAPPSPR